MAVDVEVQIDLGQIPLSDLVEELKSRPGFDKNELRNLYAFELIEHLEGLGCPPDLIKALYAWDDLPIVGNEHLNKWLEMCQQK